MSHIAPMAAIHAPHMCGGRLCVVGPYSYFPPEVSHVVIFHDMLGLLLNKTKCLETQWGNCINRDVLLYVSWDRSEMVSSLFSLNIFKWFEKNHWIWFLFQFFDQTQGKTLFCFVSLPWKNRKFWRSARRILLKEFCEKISATSVNSSVLSPCLFPL